MADIAVRGDRGPGRVVLVGNSHRQALYDAWDRREALGIEAVNVPASVSMVSGIRLCPGPVTAVIDNQDYWDVAIREASGQIVVVTWQGNQHNRFLFRVAANFDVLPVGFVVDRIEKPAFIIPFGLAEAYFRNSLDYDGGNIEDILRRLGGGAERMFVLGTPPPKSNATILSNLEREPGYIVAAKAKGVDLGNNPLTPVATRVSLWQCLQSAMAKVCREVGTEFVEVPLEASEVDGCLKDCYCERDATHANALFGALMWKEVMRRLHVK